MAIVDFVLAPPTPRRNGDLGDVGIESLESGLDRSEDFGTLASEMRRRESTDVGGLFSTSESAMHHEPGFGSAGRRCLVSGAIKNANRHIRPKPHRRPSDE